MSKNKLKHLVIEFLKDNPINDNEKNKYKDLSKIFKVPPNVISRWWWEAKLNKAKLTIEKPQAKVLLFDIETSPYEGRFWRLFNTNINQNDITKDSKILCFSAKWLFEEDVISHKMTEEEHKRMDDGRIVKELWKLIDEANIVISHNGVRFDHKRANSKFLEQGLFPPSPYQVIDTYLSAKKHFGEPSNKLDWWARKFGKHGKIKSAGLWDEVMDGNYNALLKMEKYCQNDVIILEDVYLIMRPFIQPHPNLGLYITENIQVCPSCGGKHLTKLDKEYKTTVSSYVAYRCDSCGSLSRDRKNNNKVKVLSSIPQR